MKNKFWKNILRGSVSLCLACAVFTTSSMVALAGSSDKQMGELIVAGANDSSFVTVDGERAVSGRSIMSSSTITTPANTGATISLGKAGRVEIAPDSTVSLNFTEKAISANLAAGKVKVFNAAGVESKISTKDETVTADANQNNLLSVDLLTGKTNAAAETGSATLSNGAKVGQTSGGSGGLSSSEVLIPVAIFAGIVAISAIYVFTQDDDNLPGTVSGTR